MNGINLVDYVKYGVVIVSIAAICFIVYQFTALVQNHIMHSAEIMTEVRDVVRENSAAMERNTAILREVEKTLLKINGYSK